MNEHFSRTNQTNFYGIRINCLEVDQLLEQLECDFSKPGLINIFFLNAHCFVIASENDNYKNALRDATYVLPDGVGVEIGLKLKGIKDYYNMNGTDLIPRIIERFSSEGIFLLGAEPGVAETAAEVLAFRYKAKISGYADGFFQHADQVCDAINKSEAKILIVGMGVPKQELFVYQNKSNLPNLEIVVAGGAILDFTSGRIPRANELIRRMRLEWLFRFANEPGRLFQRYFVGGIKFFYLLYLGRRNKT